MTEKLDDILHKFEEITVQLSEKDTAADPERFRLLMKERALLEPVVETYRAYRTCRDAISDSEMMLRDESDPEMREMLTEEIGENRKRLPALEQELQFQLLPQDPDDGKSVITIFSSAKSM